MPAYIKNISIKNDIDSSKVNWLLANVGEGIEIEYDISVKTYSLNSTDSPWILNNTDGYLGAGWVTGGDFSMFNVGDVIQWVNYPNSIFGGTFTIVDKLSNSEIQLNTSMGVLPNNVTGTEDVFSLVLPVTSMRYKWNFIENAEALNYFSKIDGSEQIAISPELDATGSATHNMTMIGKLPYQIGEITIKEMGLSTMPVYESKFRITHKTRVTPTLLATQWDDFLNNIIPTYYDNASCLKKVAFFEARYYANDPNNIETAKVDNVLGNTGFFDENFNTGMTNYHISGLQYKDFTGATIPAPQLKTSTDTTFTFDIVNTIDNPFEPGNTRLVLNFSKCPNDETEYQNNNRDLKHNFVWDRVILTADNAPVAINGEEVGDLFVKSLIQVKATYVSPSVIRVRGTLQFAQESIDVYNESDEPRFIFFVSIQDHEKEGGNSDRVTLMVDAQPFYFQTLFPNLFSFNSKLIPHTVNDYATAVELRDTFSEDEIVGFSLVTFNEPDDKTPIEYILTRVTGKVVARNSVTGDEFTLDSASFNTSSYPIINGFQYFNIVQPRPFHVPTAEIRKDFIARFNTSTEKYEVAFPFLNRWEYWVLLQSVNSAFFNTSQPNNGFNHDWYRYFSGNWHLSFCLDIGAKINGVPQIYKSYVDYDIFTRNLVGESLTCVIKTYDPISLTELVDGSGDRYILGYKNTLVEATFTDSVNDLDTGTEHIVLGIEVWEEGGVTGKRRMSSKWDSDSDTWFLPLAPLSKVKLDQISASELKGSALIDFNQLNTSKLLWKLSARIYASGGDPSPGATDGYGYLGSQQFKMIATDPIPSTTQVLEPEKLNCCGDLIWRVLADSAGADKLNNDENTFIFWYDGAAVDSVVLKLVKSDGSEIILTGVSGTSVYGTKYDFGFFINDAGEKFIAYHIEWRKVLLTLGEGTYYIKSQVTTKFGDTGEELSDTYCLKQYTVERANGTVRIEYFLNGILGLSEFDEKTKDFGELNWYNQHRFDGFFAYSKSTYKSDYIRYANGQDVWVSDEQEPEYKLDLKPMATFKINTLRTDILQSDEMTITDYNSRNIETYYKKQVQKTSELAPKWHYLKSKLASVTITFKQSFNNLKKFRE